LSKPISLSDTELDAVMAAAVPLHPPVNRIVRELLATKNYRFETALAVGSTRRDGAA
jgi:hypothetical protein